MLTKQPTIEQRTAQEQAIYQAGIDDGKDQLRREWRIEWAKWLDREIDRRTNLLFMQDGFDMLQRGYTPDKETIGQIEQLILSSQYPHLKQAMLGYAQDSYRMSGAVKDDRMKRPYAELGNLITGFVSWLEALALKKQEPPKDAWQA